MELAICHSRLGLIALFKKHLARVSRAFLIIGTSFVMVYGIRLQLTMFKVLTAAICMRILILR